MYSARFGANSWVAWHWGAAGGSGWVIPLEHLLLWQWFVQVWQLITCVYSFSQLTGTVWRLVMRALSTVQDMLMRVQGTQMRCFVSVGNLHSSHDACSNHDAFCSSCHCRMRIQREDTTWLECRFRNEESNASSCPLCTHSSHVNCCDTMWLMQARVLFTWHVV